MYTKKILHVEDSSEWRAHVANALRLNGHQITSFSNLTLAKKAFAGEAWDVVICDGRIHEFGDGLLWADDLHSQGQKVIIVASDHWNTQIPFIEKGEFNRDALLNLVEY